MSNSETSYPEWLVKTLNHFNRYNTLINEWELVDMAVDLQRQPDLSKRLDILYQSLRQGLGKDVLITGSFLALGYYDQATKSQIFPNYLELGKRSITGDLSSVDDEAAVRLKSEDDEATIFAANRALTELDLEDDEAVVHAFMKASEVLKEKGNLSGGARPLIIQVPYFVKKTEQYSPKNGDLPLGEFKDRFNEKAVLFTEIQRASSEEQVKCWVNAHHAGLYQQRFLFTLGLAIKNGIEDSLFQPQTQEAIEYLIGAFLSWAGMGVLDSTRYVMAAVAVKLAHFSHEFLKPFGKLKEYMVNNTSVIPHDLMILFNNAFEQVEMLDIGSTVRGTLSTGKGRAKGGYSFSQRLREVLARNTNFSESEDFKDGTYLLKLEKIEDQKNKQARITFKDLPATSLQIKFGASYFDRLIRNLLRNAAQHSKTEPIEIDVSFDLNKENKTLSMLMTHRGSEIKRSIRRRLFRLPILREDDSGSRGIGLWTIGMAFEAERLPMPEVLQTDDGVCFIFRFPVTSF
ncbi:MAG: hypothetical protein V7641_2724 [Blastocatellia bacterium]